MAGLKIGVYKSLKDIAKNWQADKSFKPGIKNSERKILIDGWSKAIKKLYPNIQLESETLEKIEFFFDIYSLFKLT